MEEGCAKIQLMHQRIRVLNKCCFICSQQGNIKAMSQAQLSWWHAQTNFSLSQHELLNVLIIYKKTYTLEHIFTRTRMLFLKYSCTKHALQHDVIMKNSQ
jgi:hypothetical protein